MPTSLFTIQLKNPVKDQFKTITITAGVTGTLVGAVFSYALSKKFIVLLNLLMFNFKNKIKTKKIKFRVSSYSC